MKLLATLGLLSAICISCAIASPDDESGAAGYKQCKRALPLMPWRKSYRLKCTYLCKGWPFRYGNEPDGIPCGAMQPITGRRNVCMAGRCVEYSLTKLNRRKHRTTETPTSQERGTTYNPTQPKEHYTTNVPTTTDVTSHKPYRISTKAFRTTTGRDNDVAATTVPRPITQRPPTTTAWATKRFLTTEANKAGEGFTTSADRDVAQTITPSTSSATETKVTAHVRKVGEVSTTNTDRAVSRAITATTSLASETTFTTEAPKASEGFATSLRPDMKKGVTATTPTFTTEQDESTKQSIA